MRLYNHNHDSSTLALDTQTDRQTGRQPYTVTATHLEMVMDLDSQRYHQCAHWPGVMPCQVTS